MPFFKSKPKVVEHDNEVFFRLDCKYIGSQAVSSIKKDEQQRFVNEKLTEMKGGLKGVSVVFVISTSGLKTYGRHDMVVKLAHAITRISSSMCNPEGRLFAYVARTRQSNGVLNMQAHIYRTKKTSHAQQLTALTSRAFKLAFAKETFVRKNAAVRFDEEIESEVDSEQAASVARRRWAKKEMAIGHDNSNHASRARLSSGAQINETWAEDDYPQGVTSTNSDTDPGQYNADNTGIPSTNDATLNGTREHADGIAKQEAPSLDPGRNDSFEDSALSTSNTSAADNKSCEEEFVTPALEPVTTSPLPRTKVPYDNYILNSAIDSDFSPSNVNNESQSVSESFSPVPRKSSNVVTEVDLLDASEWFQEGLSRELCEEILLSACEGSFIIRSSQSSVGSYGMTLCCQGPPDLLLRNFLISRLDNGAFNIQGCKAVFDSVTDLVAHYASTRDELPVRLRLADDNPLFAKEFLDDSNDPGADCNMNDETASSASVKEEPIYAILDPDYDHYCNSEIIMQELQRCASF